VLCSADLFAIPGIAALIVFLFVRPQEAFPLLQKVPFLHLFTGLAVLGYVIDVRLRRLQPVGCPTLPWIGAFILWALACCAAIVPEQLITKTIELAILFALYGTIAHGVQRFRTLQVVAGAVCVTMLFIIGVCVIQGMSDMQCIGGQEIDGEVSGTPDGRLCETSETCRIGAPDPTLDYRCEHVGPLGTFSVQERVRYRGDLQDPNEVALATSAGGFAMIIAFGIRKRGALSRLMITLGAALIVTGVFMTQSRGGLIAAMLVPGVYLVRKYGVKVLVPALAFAVPVMMLAGRSGESADLSTEMRYEAWATGLDMFRHSPIFGVGPGQFAQHNYLTAHNSFVLTLGELGIVGMFLFVSIVYLSVKCLIVGLRALRDVPGSEVAQTWAMALLAAMAGIVFQINTLSFAYHPVLWTFFGLCGGWCSAVRYHLPGFDVRLTARDITIIAVACVIYVFGVLPLFLRVKGIT
jgi:O-antigen ligase